MDTATSTREAIYRLRDFVSQRILGQERLVERLLVALLCDGQLLVEGPPGLAKTRAIKIWAKVSRANSIGFSLPPISCPQTSRVRKYIALRTVRSCSSRDRCFTISSSPTRLSSAPQW